jgi:hypothetical protein
MIQFAMPGFLGIYALTIASISDKVDNIIGMAPNTVVIGSSAIAGVMAMLAFATSKSAMRAAVLTADGYHLRVYPYGSFFGLVWLTSSLPAAFSQYRHVGYAGSRHTGYIAH